MRIGNYGIEIINITKRLLKNRWFFLVATSIVICVFFYQYLATGSKIIGGDFDYYAQMYEAFRTSVLKYGQFPWWNPWMSGGLPLFANPQFGLFSIQSLLVIPLGAVYGLKVAYVLYAIAGFWGMYLVGQRIVGADKTRALFASFIWIFSGFFAGHSIAHFTFALFFLMPWLIFFTYNRRQKWAWLWLGLTLSIIMLSSVHYAFLMMSLVVTAFFIFSLVKLSHKESSCLAVFKVSRRDISFVAKVVAITVVLSGFRFMQTWLFISGNERFIGTGELYPTLGVLLSSIFLPVGTILEVPHSLQWGWWEYSAYVGVGTGVAFLICLVLIVKNYFAKPKIKLLRKKQFILPVFAVGVLCFILALGDFGLFSPYNILHHLPGFSQTRVPSRWLITCVFAILIFLLSIKSNKKLINGLLLMGVVELFIMFGPIFHSGSDQLKLPPANYSRNFTQFDNGQNHLDLEKNIDHSYLYATKNNRGQIYSDDSIINTLNRVYGTSKCGYNIDKSCDFVLSDNATISYWSPNKIILKRTAPGPIELNMNRERGWRVNDTYPFADRTGLDPSLPFVITDTRSQSYEISYQPRLSPGWFLQKLQL